jgi:hypothetical protein
MLTLADRAEKQRVNIAEVTSIRRATVLTLFPDAHAEHRYLDTISFDSGSWEPDGHHASRPHGNREHHGAVDRPTLLTVVLTVFTVPATLLTVLAVLLMTLSTLK